MSVECLFSIAPLSNVRRRRRSRLNAGAVLVIENPPARPMASSANLKPVVPAPGLAPGPDHVDSAPSASASSPSSSL